MFVCLQEEAKNKYIEFVNSLVGPENSAESTAAPKSAAAGFEMSMDGKLRIITINKPARKNAFSQEMYSDFAKVRKRKCSFNCVENTHILNRKSHSS